MSLILEDASSLHHISLLHCVVLRRPQPYQQPQPYTLVRCVAMLSRSTGSDHSRSSGFPVESMMVLKSSAAERFPRPRSPHHYVSSSVPVLPYHYYSLQRRTSLLLEEQGSADLRLESSPYVPVINSILFSPQQYCINNMTHLVLDDETSKRIWLLVSMFCISGFAYPNDIHNQTRQWMVYKMQPSRHCSSLKKTCVPSYWQLQMTCPRSSFSIIICLSFEY